jgi:acyl carrier protein
MSSADEVRDWLICRLCAVFDLPRERVTGATSFDDLGMDSITRAGLVREIEQQFRVSVDPDELYDHPTIHDLARRVVRR